VALASARTYTNHLYLAAILLKVTVNCNEAADVGKKH